MRAVQALVRNRAAALETLPITGCRFLTEIVAVLPIVGKTLLANHAVIKLRARLNALAYGDEINVSLDLDLRDFCGLTSLA
jgi:hypothetical protein